MFLLVLFFEFLASLPADPFQGGMEVLLADLCFGVQFDLTFGSTVGALKPLLSNVEMQIRSASLAGKDPSTTVVDLPSRQLRTRGSLHQSRIRSTGLVSMTFSSLRKSS